MHGEKKTVLYRYGAVVTALLMLLAVFVLPVKKVAAWSYYDYNTDNASSYGIDVSSTPGNIKYGSSFSLYITFKNESGNAKAYEGYTVELHGTDGLSGSPAAIQAQKVNASDESDNADTYIYVPAGSLTYDGEKTPILEIKIKGDSTVYRCVLNHIPGTADDDKDDGTDEPDTPPELIGNQITVAENAFMPEIEAGQTKTITIPLEATRNVRTAQVTLTMPEGLYLNSASATQTVNFGSSRKASITYEVTASESVTDSVAAISIDSVYEYYDAQKTEKTTFSVRLKAKQTIESTGGLVITGYTLGDQILKYGGNTTLTINIQNTSDQMMKDIVMELGGLTAQQITVRNGMDVQRLVELAPGASSSFTYDLHADDTVTDGTAILTATVSCGTASSGGSGDTSDGTGGAVSSTF